MVEMLDGAMRSARGLTCTYWTLTGLIVEPGKKYSQVVENSFHISKATIDLSAATGIYLK